MSEARPPELDAGLLARIEDAGVNASAPREQRWVDGWLLRTSPGKAKRARCIQPVAPGTLPIDAKLARCLPAFRAAGLRPYVRITPFAQPAGLDRHLERLGMARVDDSLVLVASVDAVLARAAAREVRGRGESIEPIDAAPFAEWIGLARGSSVRERRAHAERIAQSPVPYRAFALRAAAGDVVAGAQLAIEDDLAGLYDVLTLESRRGRGLAAALCARLAAEARGSGVGTLYLQVDAGNGPALALYRRLGFGTAYAYHYRTPADPADVA